MAGGSGARVPEELPKLWTVEEADRRLPSLTELFARLREWSSRLAEVRGELARLAGFWGNDLASLDHPDHEIAARLEREEGNLTSRLEEAVGSLSAEGVEVKDLAGGLVDFYALLGDEVVLLCWKLGEPEVGFFHTLTGGYAGRRPLPSRLRSTRSPPP